MKGRKHSATAFMHRQSGTHPVVPAEGKCLECGRSVTLTVLGYRHDFRKGRSAAHAELEKAFAMTAPYPDRTDRFAALSPSPEPATEPAEGGTSE